MTAIKDRLYFLLFELLAWATRMPEGSWEMARHVLIGLVLDGPALLACNPVAWFALLAPVVLWLAQVWLVPLWKARRHSLLPRVPNWHHGRFAVR